MGNFTTELEAGKIRAMSVEFIPSEEQQEALLRIDRTLREQNHSLGELRQEVTLDSFLNHSLRSRNFKEAVLAADKLEIPKRDIFKAVVRGTLPPYRKELLQYLFISSQEIDKEEAIEIAEELNIHNFHPLDWSDMSG